jgi:hypothetical protein
MSSKKQTAVEWYENEINTLFKKYESKEISKIDFIIIKHNLFYSAIAIERDQIIEAYENGEAEWTPFEFKTAQDYYTSTFGS